MQDMIKEVKERIERELFSSEIQPKFPNSDCYTDTESLLNLLFDADKKCSLLKCEAEKKKEAFGNAVVSFNKVRNTFLSKNYS